LAPLVPLTIISPIKLMYLPNLMYLLSLTYLLTILMYLRSLLGHIHNQDTQMDNLITKMTTKKTILDFYYIYYFMILMDWYMTITRMMSC
jgi:hypothetical protein